MKVDPAYLVALAVLPAPFAGWTYVAVAVPLALALLVFRVLELRTHRDATYELLKADLELQLKLTNAKLDNVAGQLQPIPDQLDNRLKSLETRMSAATTYLNKAK